MSRIRRPTEDRALGRIVREENRKKREARRLEEAKERRREFEEKRKIREVSKRRHVIGVWRDTEDQVEWEVVFYPEDVERSQAHYETENVMAENADDAIEKVRGMYGEIDVKTVERV